MWAVGVLLGSLVVLFLLLRESFFRVDEGHVAAIESFGAAIYGADKRLVTHGPGLHRKWPWQRPVDVSLMEQTLELSGEGAGQQAMARDGTVLRFDSVLRYRVDENDIAKFVFGMEKPVAHITGLFTCVLRNEIANFDAKFEAKAGAARSDEGGFDAEAESSSYIILRRGRTLLNEHIEAFCQTALGGRYGVRFNAVDLTEIAPPDELADALNAVIQARNETDTAYFRAEATCQQRVLAATKGVQIARKRAEAVALEMRKVATYLEPLSREGTLDAYVSRRKSEVLSEARVSYVNEEGSR